MQPSILKGHTYLLSKQTINDLGCQVIINRQADKRPECARKLRSKIALSERLQIEA